MQRGLVVVVAFALVVLVTGRARAQPGNTPVTASPATIAPPPVTGPLPGEKSPSAALLLSLGGTIGSYVLLGASDESGNDGLATVGSIGSLLAPSFGHWYAGKGWTDGLTLRLAGVGGVFVGALLLLGDCGFEGSCDNEGPAMALIAIGAGAYLGGTVYDIATASGQADRYNGRLRERAAGGRWAIAPVVSHGGGSLVLGGRF